MRKNTSRVEIIITISIENRIKSNKIFGHVLRAIFYTVGTSDILDRYFHSNLFNREPAATGERGRVGFLAKNFSQKNAYSQCLFRVKRVPSYSVHSAIGCRMNE